MAAVPVPGRTTDGAPAMVPSVPASAVTLKYREDDFQVRRASERGPPRDAATARLSWRKDAARTIDNSIGPSVRDVLFLFPLLCLFLSRRQNQNLTVPESESYKIRIFWRHILLAPEGYLTLLLSYALNLIYLARRFYTIFHTY